ncbi:MAG: YciI family protein [Hyphomonadaceae bacterium]|nr:YciI family protein [Hyphomonadaceae bacterium]
MKHFLLIYEYEPDYLEKRAAVRATHLELARASVARDELQLGGAVSESAMDDGGADWEEPPFGLLVFKAETPQVAIDFARADPYVTNGVVSSWRVREWVTVVGPLALTKV